MSEARVRLRNTQLSNIKSAAKNTGTKLRINKKNVSSWIISNSKTKT